MLRINRNTSHTIKGYVYFSGSVISEELRVAMVCKITQYFLD